MTRRRQDLDLDVAELQPLARRHGRMRERTRGLGGLVQLGAGLRPKILRSRHEVRVQMGVEDPDDLEAPVLSPHPGSGERGDRDR